MLIGRAPDMRVGQQERAPGRATATLGRKLNSVEIHQGTHTRRDMRVGSTLRAALGLDRFIGGARFATLRPEESELCARAVPHWVPLLTDDARQFGRGCVCACPCQGATCGCRLRSGATLIFLRPAHLPPAGATRPLPTHPKVRSSGALAPNERATLSAVHGPAHSRPSAASGGAIPRRSFSLRRLQPGSDTAQDITQLLGSATPLVGGLRHARQIGGVDVREAEIARLHSGEVFRERGN